MLNAKINNSKSKMERIRESVIPRGSDPLGVRSHLTRPQISGANFREPKLSLHPKH